MKSYDSQGNLTIVGRIAGNANRGVFSHLLVCVCHQTVQSKLKLLPHSLISGSGVQKFDIYLHTSITEAMSFQKKIHLLDIFLRR